MTKARFYIPGILLLLGLAYAINMNWLQTPNANAPSALEKAGNGLKHVFTSPAFCCC